MSKIIEFKNVTKTYKLFKNEKNRIISMFFKKKWYNEKHVLSNISFTINKGESVALFGKNGAGKSTILKLITGVSFPTSGKITVNGRVSALLELTTGFDSEFTGRENIFLKGSILGLKKTEIKKLLPKIIEFADIDEYIDQPVKMYSSGMKARLGFAICVSIDPEILIIDEALSVGDKNFKKKCLAKIKELIEQKNVTLLFVTHSINIASNFCSRGLVLNDGKILYDGDVKKAVEKYEKNVF